MLILLLFITCAFASIGFSKLKERKKSDTFYECSINQAKKSFAIAAFFAVLTATGFVLATTDLGKVTVDEFKLVNIFSSNNESIYLTFYDKSCAQQGNTEEFIYLFTIKQLDSDKTIPYVASVKNQDSIILKDATPEESKLIVYEDKLFFLRKIFYIFMIDVDKYSYVATLPFTDISRHHN